MVYSYKPVAGRVSQTCTGKDAARPQYAALREVRAYWDALRDDQDLPRRDQINPRGMAGALHQVFMLERVAPGIARFRLAGMDINDLMGMEVRGMPLSALFDPSARARLAELLEKVTVARTIVDMELESDRGIGRPALRARLVLLPLLGAAGEADLVLGCLACDGQIGRAPRRFMIVRAVEAMVDAKALSKQLQLDLPMEPTRTAFAPRPAFARLVELVEPAIPQFVAPAAKAGRPYLRLVQLQD